MHNANNAKKVVFNEISLSAGACATKDLSYVIRTDADYATKSVKKALGDMSVKSGFPAMRCPKTPEKIDENDIKATVHDAYKEWVHSISEITIHSFKSTSALNTSSSVEIGVFDSKELEKSITNNAKNLVTNNAGKNTSVYDTIYISLDSQIHAHNKPNAEIAFSREFEIDGVQKANYVHRPGFERIEKQILALNKKIQEMRSNAPHINLVLLEDNIRHARMMNWVIDRLDEQHVFDHAQLAGISTGFCSAKDDELAKIHHKGRQIPVQSVVDFHGSNADVITPRDMMFDGYVVDIGNGPVRLPGIFMNPSKKFDIEEDKIYDFQRHILYSNMRFCRRIENAFGVTIPLSSLASGEAIAQIRNVPLETPVINVMASRLKEIQKAHKVGMP